VQADLKIFILSYEKLEEMNSVVGYAANMRLRSGAARFEQDFSDCV